MKLIHLLLFAIVALQNTDAFGLASTRMIKGCTSHSRMTNSALFAEGENVRKPQLVAKIAEKTGMTKADSDAALAAVLESIVEEVSAGNKVSMIGFGTFKLTSRAARKGRNPKTGETIDIKASNRPAFTVGKAFKERCNE
uniref:DNA-binding protein HU n=1 Tax=Eucampia antarctica TaxID=49252 RepID=A0A7S2W3F4_9STRA|mmetsp:Transcript_18622/g.17933  ORF Transcript_18622/g.17933 Transcript_18622/m.17933 type:complete len:140 (+) Transcript_18622:126-545(+)|eukprot:CAMPEP_0197824628 /NCGR_PEP_ID=MMETSP1437-20131217/1847_1 /TAXON_ID=49252 ORGANISM="Eucampia antarctica, Strain CCMP1452" /NCGR_SAMPLE_ID=MMETSP1437 /ASSEMBLY_ACC=CAM_ASM_001096 /LENGTH=139 /DNA_ID=CAMNT_0043424327 /DNA_START=120 /DNA_END=539 /DNA_ORIENTATION=+